METLIEFISTFEGIIGAVLGGLVGSTGTLVTTHLLKNFGKTTFYLTDFEMYLAQDTGWGPQKIEKNEIIDGYINLGFLIEKCNIEVYNNSENYKVYREIRLVFYKDEKKLFEIAPNDNFTRKSTQYGFSISKLLNLNLPPKVLSEISISDHIINEDYEKIKIHDSIYLEMKNPKGHLEKFKIK